MALTKDSYRGLPHAPQRKVSIPEPKKTEKMVLDTKLSRDASGKVIVEDNDRVVKTAVLGSRCKCREKLMEAIPVRGDISKGEKDRFCTIVREVL